MLYSVRNKEMAIAAAKWIAQQLPLGLYTVLNLFDILQYLQYCSKIGIWTDCPKLSINNLNKMSTAPH